MMIELDAEELVSVQLPTWVWQRALDVLDIYEKRIEARNRRSGVVDAPGLAAMQHARRIVGSEIDGATARDGVTVLLSRRTYKRLLEAVVNHGHRLRRHDSGTRHDLLTMEWISQAVGDALGAPDDKRFWVREVGWGYAP